MMKAPRIKHWVYALRDGKLIMGDKITQIIERIFCELHKVAPCGMDERRELWLKAERGNIGDYGDFEKYKEEEMVDSYEEFEQLWLEEFPNEISWFNLVTVEHDDYRAIFLGRNLIYQSQVIDGGYVVELQELEELFIWIEAAVKKCIEQLKSGTYNNDVANNLYERERTGVISRKDYWDLFPEEKEGYLKDITQEEVDTFLSNISEQISDEPVGQYIEHMTAGKFYNYCAIGYKANAYQGLDGLTAKQQYYRKADGRDEDLKDIDEKSPEAFDEWFRNRKNRIGHPWEVCAGGNSTHVALYIRHDENGYYLELKGKAWSRSIETIKFYNALRADGVAVYLYDAKGLKERLCGEDIIGIVPERVAPVYCESWFPNMEILDFMNLPYEPEDYDKILSKIRWLPEEEQKLL